QYSSPTDLKIAKIIEQYSSPIDLKVAKVMEQHRTALGHNLLGKLLNNAYLETGSTLADLSVEDLFKELESRHSEFEKKPNLDQEKPAQSIKLEGSEPVPKIATGEASVTSTQDLTAKNEVLSSIPTWLLRFLVHLTIFYLANISQWESIRASVVDLNARLPQTKSPSKIRDFIRKELAGKPGDIRLVTGSDVNFRTDPSSKSEIILKLQKNSIVVVQDKENRNWLLVSYEIEGYWIDGYVSTKYLKKIKRN
ncbi:SH3 domain-containing protein, partial [Pseudomonas sp. SG-MS2]|uniref:SH3 domain-containing protein n=1 Tax=Pseudomonas sp. SG-MS2 TaxID=1914534 RepID=UPI00137B77EE